MYKESNTTNKYNTKLKEKAQGGAPEGEGAAAAPQAPQKKHKKTTKTTRINKTHNKTRNNQQSRTNNKKTIKI